jgi:hypothetical protein
VKVPRHEMSTDEARLLVVAQAARMATMDTLAFDYAIVGGLVAALLMVIAMYAGRIMGLSTDMIRVLGLFVVSEDQPNLVYAVGFVLHFLMGAVFGIIYAILFHAVAAVPHSGIAALTGALFGVLHGLTIGALLGFMPRFHPRMGSGQALAVPGFFGHNIGIGTPVVLVLLHVVYGAAVGAIYGTAFL